MAFRTRDSNLEPSMLRTCLKSPLFYDTKDARGQTRRGIRESMRRYIPEYALEKVDTRGYVRGSHLQENRRHPPRHLTARASRELKRETAHLVWVPIDKGPGELLVC